MAESYYADPSTYIPLAVTVSGNPVDGILNWFMASLDTINLVPNRYVYNIDVYFDFTNFRTLRGFIDILPGVN